MRKRFSLGRNVRVAFLMVYQNASVGTSVTLVVTVNGPGVHEPGVRARTITLSTHLTDSTYVQWSSKRSARPSVRILDLHFCRTPSGNRCSNVSRSGAVLQTMCFRC